jgi:hypothetical protein
MRRALWFAAIIVAFGLYHFLRSGTPGAREVEPVLRSYIENQCNGEIDIAELDDIRVGDYSEQLGGWPVYANHVETCVGHDASKPYGNTTKTTYDGGHDADRNVAVAMVRRDTSGRLEMYSPAFVQDAGRQAQQLLDQAFDSAKTN